MILPAQVHCYNPHVNNGKWTDREVFTGALFVVAVFLFLFWRYPFNGMTLSDSWFFYANDGGHFRWYNDAGVASQHGADPYQLSDYNPHWSTFLRNRSLIPVVAWGLSLIALPDRQTGVNIFAIFVQLLNIGLFGMVVARLAGARVARASMICAALYPFAASSHFWQFIVVNNLAATGFLAAVLAFVMIDHSSTKMSGRTLALGAATLLSFWVSMIVTAYAVFMAPVFVYLALALGNSGRRAFKSWQLSVPSMWIAGAALAINLAAIVLFSGEVPSFLQYTSRYQELAATIGLPWQVIGAAAVLASAALTFLSAAFSNTAGLVVYPIDFVARNAAVFRESAFVIAIIVVFAGAAAFLMLSPASPRPAGRTSNSHSVLYRAGGLWIVLAYVPFMTAFGYPRVVGLMSDRINILASWGVCLVLGVLISQVASLPANRLARIVAPLLFFGVAGLWLANLYVQKTYYVAAYQKERQVSLAILAAQQSTVPDSRAPVILLRRAVAIKYPRERLLAALKSGSAFERSASVVEFVVRRYFVDEYTTSGFDLSGIMLFGCCPTTAFMTVDGYAHLQGIPTVPVYKDEAPLVSEQTDSEFRLGYQDSGAVISIGHARIDRYSTATHRLVPVDLDESFFTLRPSPAPLIR